MSDARDLLAAEYALGTLTAAERDAAERLRATDPTFDRAVALWEQRLEPLAESIASVEPSPALWLRVANGISVDTRASRDTNVIDLRRSLRRWQAAAAATTALAAALAIFVIDRDILRSNSSREPNGTYVAAINREGELPALIVRVDLAAHAVTARALHMEKPPGKSLELWYVAAGRAPKSMGVLGQERARMPMPEDMEAANTTFAVSVEPSGGSLTGSPTGPVVYKGTLVPE